MSIRKKENNVEPILLDFSMQENRNMLSLMIDFLLQNLINICMLAQKIKMKYGPKLWKKLMLNYMEDMGK